MLKLAQVELHAGVNKENKFEQILCRLAGHVEADVWSA
jgi:hypothetical protein